MINKFKISHLVAIACFLVSSQISGMNVLKPYKVLLQPLYPSDWQCQCIIRNESGFSMRGYNWDGMRVSPFNAWNCDQDALAMLDGAPEDSTIGQLRALIDAHDDGTRGHVVPCGKLHLTDAFYFCFRYACCYGISAGLYLPFYNMHLRNMCWIDKTQQLNAQDARVRQYLTSQLAEQVCTLGDLYIGDWRRSGAGDVLLLSEWNYHFPQQKPYLKDVLTDARLGFTIPTGKKQDEDKILAVPFGYDGATALFIGAGLDLTLVDIFHVGFDVELHNIFGHTKERRIKTAPCQTDLLFLQKQCAYKEYGLEQQFTLFAELRELCDRLSIKIGYQFFKHNDDTLSLLSSEYSTYVANQAESLQEYTIHTLTAQVACNIDIVSCPCTSVAWFVTVPCNGKRSLASASSGLSFSFDF